MAQSQWYAGAEKGKYRCLLCPHACLLAPGQKGICRARAAGAEGIASLNYGQVTALAVDPIEKKPLYHFFPGRDILSVGTFGCNFQCRFCQNWQIAQGEPQVKHLSPQQLVSLAAGEGKDWIGIAYTYSEPLVWYEYIYDCARLAAEQGLHNVIVSNGFINPEPLAKLLPFVDAFNIDIKGFSHSFYHRYLKGRLEPVLAAIRQIHRSGKHLEVTTLLITGVNDAPDHLAELVRWLARELGPEVPLHFSRFFPNYRLTEAPPTPADSLRQAREMAREHLHYVYLGNIADPGTADTYCPQCGQTVIKRSGYRTSITGLDGADCSRCGYHLNIIIGT